MGEVWANPFELLKRFEGSRSVEIISHMLESQKDWFDRNLTGEQAEELGAIKTSLDEWRLIERDHGVGACLNLDHEPMMGALNRNRNALRRFSVHIENAKRYQHMLQQS